MDTTKIWKRSIWLSNSAHAFANHFYKDEWQAAEQLRGEKLSVQVLHDEALQARSEGIEAWEALATGVKKLSDLNTPKEQLLKRASKEILQRLQDGRYRAFGFDRPRTMDTIPVQIPRDAWRDSTSLDSNKLHYQSMTLIDVRIRMAPESADTEPKKRLHAEPSKTGRPTIKDDVEAAFHALNALGEINVILSAKAHFELVRQHLRSVHPKIYSEDGKPGDEGVRAHFSPLFKVLKKNSKQ